MVVTQFRLEIVDEFLGFGLRDVAEVMADTGRLLGGLFPVLMLALALGLGMGTLNCFLFSMFPLWQRIWNILTRPLFFVSGVIFLHDNVPQPYRYYMEWNPLTHVVGAVRSGFYARYEAAYVDPIFVFTLSAVAFVTGLLFLYRYHRDILHN